MKLLIEVACPLFATIIVLIASSYSISQSKQEDIVKEADLLLDMMEYESAIINYLKALSQNPQQRNVRKEIGYAYYQLEKIDDALNYLKDELTLFPDNEDAYDLLVYIFFKLNKLNEAENFLGKLLTEENPHLGGMASFILGLYYREPQKYDKARKYFLKALEKKYDPIKCWIQLLNLELIEMSLVEDRRFARGELFFHLKEAVEYFGPQPEFFFIQGLAYFEIAKTISPNFWIYPIRATIKSFEEALKLRPDFKEALFNLASISYNLKDFKRASEYFRRILEFEPENAEVKIYLSCCLRKLDKSEDKELISERCPKNINFSREFIDNPSREYKYKFKNDISFVAQNINHLALEFISKGEFQKALKRFSNGLKIDPESPGFHFNTGMVYSWLNNYEEAEKHALLALRKKDYFGTIPDNRKKEILRKEKGIRKGTSIPLSRWTFEVALKEGNYFTDAYNSLGTIYYKKKEYEKSILAFKKVIKIYPQDAMGHYNLGCTYWAIEDFETAEKEWKDAIKHEEELKKAEKRGKISKDQLDVSLIVLKRAVSFRAHKYLGRLYLERKLSDKALKEFKKVIKLQPGDPEPYYEVGKIYEAKSELNEKYVDKAIFYYEKYLYLGGKEQAEVKKLLKSLK